jgi:hypothetical protein
MNRRHFLAGLFAAPAIIKLDMLMPLRIWRPVGSLTRNIGMGPFVAFRASDLIGVDLDLGRPMTFSGSPGQVFFSLTERSAGFVAAATNRRNPAIVRAAAPDLGNLQSA